MAKRLRAGIKVYGLDVLLANLSSLGGPVLTKASRKALWEAGAHLERKLKERLSQPGSGITYKRPGVKTGRYAMHKASAPGEPPAPDTGRLRSSITHNVTGKLGKGTLPDPGGSKTKAKANIGTNVMYGYYLERGFRGRPYGNPKLAPIFVKARPWFYVTFEAEKGAVGRIIRESLRTSIATAKMKKVARGKKR